VHLLEMRNPQQIFVDLMKPMDTGDMDKFEWVDESKSSLKPTEDKPSYEDFKYEDQVAVTERQVFSIGGRGEHAQGAQGGPTGAVSLGTRLLEAPPVDGSGGARGADRPAGGGDGGRDCLLQSAEEGRR
jgi:hypothetical protein